MRNQAAELRQHQDEQRVRNCKAMGSWNGVLSTEKEPRHFGWSTADKLDLSGGSTGGLHVGESTTPGFATLSFLSSIPFCFFFLFCNFVSFEIFISLLEDQKIVGSEAISSFLIRIRSITLSPLFTPDVIGPE